MKRRDGQRKGLHGYVVDHSWVSEVENETRPYAMAGQDGMNSIKSPIMSQ